MALPNAYPKIKEFLPLSDRQGVIDTLAGLGISTSEYFVIGGANMVLRDVKLLTTDVDILVSDAAFAVLQEMPGAELHEPPLRARRQGADNNTVWIRNRTTPLPISATTRLGDGFYPLSFETHREATELVEGIPCLTLDHVEAAKTALQRPKDILDLRDIARHLGKFVDLPQPAFVPPFQIS